ncbi:VRR-NUC domain-containing protein, partial [Pseudomonas syringae pv. tagetis]
MKPAEMTLFKPKRTRAKSVYREGLEQAAMLRELKLRMPLVAALIYPVPNGGHRRKRGA